MREETEFEAHDSYVLDLAFTADGETLISASMDNTLKIWATADWSLVRTIDGHTHSVNSLALAPDESLLLSGSTDQTVRLWSFPDGHLLHTLQDRKQTVAAVAFSPRGDWVAAASYGGRIAVWTRQGELVVGIKAAKGNLNSVAFSPDGATLATSGLGGDITLWALPSGEPVALLAGHSVAAGSLAFVDGGRYLLSLGYEQAVTFWDTTTWTATYTHALAGKRVRGLLVSADFSLPAISLESKVELRSVAGWGKVAELPVSTKVVSSMAFSADGQRLAIGAADRKIRIWDLTVDRTAMTV